MPRQRPRVHCAGESARVGIEGAGWRHAQRLQFELKPVHRCAQRQRGCLPVTSVRAVVSPHCSARGSQSAGPLAPSHINATGWVRPNRNHLPVTRERAVTSPYCSARGSESPGPACLREMACAWAVTSAGRYSSMQMTVSARVGTVAQCMRSVCGTSHSGCGICQQGARPMPTANASVDGESAAEMAEWQFMWLALWRRHTLGPC